MGIYKYRLTSENMKTFVSLIDFFHLEPNFAISAALQVLLADHAVILENHIDGAL